MLLASSGAALLIPGIGSAEPAAAAPVVKTVWGRVRGARHGGVMEFLGIPYGADTSGAARFRPARPPTPWAGIREATRFGPRCPQLGGAAWTGDLGVYWPSDPHAPPEPRGEDCLVLNVWTPSADASARPVMLWVHGGAFAFGSAAPYVGGALAWSGDVVVVGVNHRLNVFGHLYLAELTGGEFADSGNVGLLDLVTALSWVRDNLRAFGGDPRNVTLFGQSGGGFKICALMAMPAAKGLFHKAIVQSGAYPDARTPDAATRYARAFLAELDLAPSQAAQLQRLPADRLVAAMGALAAKGTSPILALAPVHDGRSLPNNPWDPVAPATAADIPLMIGTTRTETTVLSLMLGAGPEIFELDEAAARSRLAAFFHTTEPQAARIMAGYRSDNPGATPSDIYFLATTEPWRLTAIRLAECKLAQHAAPTYMYLFAWPTPILGGRLRAGHCLEVPFVLHDVDDKTNGNTGSSPTRYPLQDQVSGAWVAFARGGNPNHAGLPNWAPYTLEDRSTMIFDTPSRQVKDPGRLQRMTLADLRAPF